MWGADEIESAVGTLLLASSHVHLFELSCWKSKPAQLDIHFLVLQMLVEDYLQGSPT